MKRPRVVLSLTVKQAELVWDEMDRYSRICLTKKHACVAEGVANLVRAAVVKAMKP